MKKNNLIILILILAFCTSFLTFILINAMSIVGMEEYIWDVIVPEDDIMGFKVDPDGFHFGMVPRGSSAQREFKIHQVRDDVKVSFRKSGDKASWVSTPPDLILRSGDDRNVTLSIGIPADAAPGNYSGIIKVVLRKI